MRGAGGHMWQRRGGEEERRASEDEAHQRPELHDGLRLGCAPSLYKVFLPWDREAGSVGEGWKRMGARRGVPGRDCGRLWGREHAAAGAGTASAQPHAKP